MEPDGFTADLASGSYSRTTVRAKVLTQLPDIGGSPARVVARLGGGWLILDCRMPVPATPGTTAAIARLFEALNRSGADLSG
jgi:hypothetical protein